MLIEKDNPYGPMTLYFGCKGRNWDYLYKPELLKYHEDKVLENYHVAFSREQVIREILNKVKVLLGTKGVCSGFNRKASRYYLQRSF